MDTRQNLNSTSHGMTDLEQSLASAFVNAENQMWSHRRHTYNWYTDNNSNEPNFLFANWLFNHWGITINPAPRLSVVYEPGGSKRTTKYWRIQSVASDERLVLFKLTYGA
jgi:hypothetical protein